MIEISQIVKSLYSSLLVVISILQSGLLIADSVLNNLLLVVNSFLSRLLPVVSFSLTIRLYIADSGLAIILYVVESVLYIPLEVAGSVRYNKNSVLISIQDGRIQVEESRHRHSRLQVVKPLMYSSLQIAIFALDNSLLIAASNLDSFGVIFILFYSVCPAGQYDEI